MQNVGTTIVDSSNVKSASLERQIHCRHQRGGKGSSTSFIANKKS